MSETRALYFVNEELSKKVAVLEEKAQDWTNSLNNNNYLEKARKSWMAYYGAQNGDSNESHKILFTGEQGEFTKIVVNHYRNFATHIMNFTTENKVALEAQAVNTDYKSQSQAILANGLLDYYMYQKRLEDFLKRATEYAVVLGEGWVRLGWNTQKGDPSFNDEETDTMYYKGDLEYSNLSPFDVVRDMSCDGADTDWVLIRTPKNRYDLIAKYPQYEKEILGLNSIDVNDMFNLMNTGTDKVFVWEFYHKRSEAVPRGNYMQFVSKDAVFYNGDLPYREIPLYRITMSDVMGAPLGYTSLWDLLPLQEAINSAYSTILTNQSTFGVQIIIGPKGADINPQQLANGLAYVEYDPTVEGGGKPEALNLTHTPQEVFTFLDKLESSAETISGVNSVVRGNPEASLRTGNALALIQSQAVQYASGLQQSYVKLLEDVGTGTIQILQDYADEPRVAAISGKSNRMYLREFKGTDIAGISRVIVKVSNALAKTTSGKTEIANNLLQMGQVDKHEYITVLNTGELDNMYEGELSEVMCIRRENEEMLDGNVPIILDIDDHVLHIKEHKAILSDPAIRRNTPLVQLVLAHMRAHVEMLQTASPELLMLLGQTPLPPPGAGLPQGAPQDQGPGQPIPPSQTALQAPLPKPGQAAAEATGLPQMPTPAGDPNAPVTAEQGFANQV